MGRRAAHIKTCSDFARRLSFTKRTIQLWTTSWKNPFFARESNIAIILPQLNFICSVLLFQLDKKTRLAFNQPEPTYREKILEHTLKKSRSLKNSSYFAKKNPSTKSEKTQTTGGLGHCVLQVYVQKKACSIEQWTCRIKVSLY